MLSKPWEFEDELPDKICIFILLEEKLKEALENFSQKISLINKKPAIPNTFHTSLRHLTDHRFKPEELSALESAVAEVIKNFIQFSFKQEKHMVLDEDKDVELNLLMEETFYPLRQAIMEIPAPGKSEDYDPHCTVYYGVTQEQAVDDYLRQETLDDQIPFYATTIGIGVLGEENNLIEVLKTIPLLPRPGNEASPLSRL
jgi:hypothetical protein